MIKHGFSYHWPRKNPMGYEDRTHHEHAHAATLNEARRLVRQRFAADEGRGVVVEIHWQPRGGGLRGYKVTL
jgi:hypothetical protein